MDFFDRLARIGVLLLFAGGIGYFTWNAYRSGEITGRGFSYERTKQPGFFFAWLVVRLGLALFVAVVALALAIGWNP